MFFAAADPSGEAIKNWLLVLGFLLSIAGNVVGLIAFFRKPTKQQREVSFSFEPASKVEFDRHVKLTNQTLEKLARDSDERRRAIYEKLEKLGDRMGADVTQVREHVAGLERGFELLDQRMVLMDQKLDRAIERRRAM
jgi:hypothetical protein